MLRCAMATADELCGVVANGLVAGGLVAGGLVAGGLVAGGLVAGGLVAGRVTVSVHIKTKKENSGRFLQHKRLASNVSQ